MIKSIRQSLFENLNLVKSRLLHDLAASLPDYSEELGYFFNCFNHMIAVRDGIIEMAPGSCPELDSAKNCVSQWESKFEFYLKEQETRLK